MFNTLAQAAATCTVNGESVPCPDFGSIAAWGIGLLIGFALLFLWMFIFWIIMLVHVLSHDVKDKIVWAIVIIFTGILGALIYYFVVKRRFNKSTRHHAVP